MNLAAMPSVTVCAAAQLLDAAVGKLLAGRLLDFLALGSRQRRVHRERGSAQGDHPVPCLLSAWPTKNSMP